MTIFSFALWQCFWRPKKKKGTGQQCEEYFLIRCSTSAAVDFCGVCIHLEDLPVFTSSAAGVGTLPSHVRMHARVHTHRMDLLLWQHFNRVRQIWRNADILPGASAAWGGAGPGDSGGRARSDPGRLRQEWQPQPLGLRGKSTWSHCWALSVAPPHLRLPPCSAVHYQSRLMERTSASFWKGTRCESD